MTLSRITEPYQIKLTGTLAEFRTALQEEIDAARRNASVTAVSLTNGRRIANIGGSYQYVFDIENALNLPGDTPGDLYIPNRNPLEVSVISIDGMAITLSIPVDLGAFVPIARLQSNLVFLMRKLIERIEEMANTSNPAGDRVLKGLSAGKPAPVELPEEICNDEQRSAVASSLGRNTTFIWGPPGTGKTRTIGVIGEKLYRQERSVLLVSHTNTAVDQALWQIADALDETAIEDGHVIRVGDPKDLMFEARPGLLLKTHVDKRSAELADRKKALDLELLEITKEIKQISRYIEIHEWIDQAQEDIVVMTRDIDDLHKLEERLERAIVKRGQLRATSVKWAIAAEEARSARQNLDGLDVLDKRIAEIRDVVSKYRRELDKTTTLLEKAEDLYGETTSVGWLVRRWRRLPSPEQQLGVVENLRRRLDDLGAKLNDANHEIETAMGQRAKCLDEIKMFSSRYSDDPDEVLRQATAHNEEISQLEIHIKKFKKVCAKSRMVLEEVLRHRLIVLKEWNLTQQLHSSAEVMLNAIQTAYESAAIEIDGYALNELLTDRNELNTRIRLLEAEILEIEDALTRIEDLVIADASVVATTLTRAYLRDSIQSRRFDTVILDEASMAPIPALWVAAGLADTNAVVVGDFKQLPPIVLSNHELAQKWLGRDIFKVAGISDLPTAPPYLVELLTQYRMRPEISAIPNKFFYEGQLRDDENTLNDKSLIGWYRHDWGHDNPVLLIDTGSVGAWVTSVPGAGRSSRLNFLSATICVNLAEQILADGRPELLDGDRPRILIVCPYRPHAQLLRLLLKEQHLLGDVMAGTAHSFQGSEADVVILDLVNDEPHWKVRMFIPRFDEGTSRLLNVALTRAKRRLFVVGDFEYIAKHSRRAFLGGELIPFLQKKYPRVDAQDIAPSDLAARAAKAQSAILGGEIEPDADRVVVTQEKFYPMLQGDFARACARIVIYSAFITQDRLGQLEPQMRAAIERGLRIYVVTKAHSDRQKSELPQYRMLEQALTNWGVVVIHKRGMHEKLVFIDDRILWSGSLNPLSYHATQEIMERREGKEVVKDYSRTLHLNELVGEYDTGPPVCPICGSEVVASEGKDDPFFWRCVEDKCYSRSIDQPRLEGGIITCSNCSGDVEFGEWGGKPVWRCTKNRRHHQRIARTHLRLPKMRAIVPKQKLRVLDKSFGISPASA